MPAVRPAARGRVARALLSLLVSLGLAGALAVAAQPAAAGTLTATSVHTSAATIDYDRRADMVIRVYDAASHALGGVAVRVYRHSSSGNTLVTTVTTGSTSHVAHFRPRLRHTHNYLLVFRGTSRYAGSSEYRRIHVRSFGASLLHIGSTRKGDPYQWGAAGPYRFDCSGFTLWVADHYGKNLPHSSSAQYGDVRHIAKSDKRVGDLVFFHDSSGGIYHVGLYAGSGRVLAATHTGDYVRLETIWTSSYYVGRLNP